MGITRGPNIVTDGLVFAVDAANPSSYPGSGTTWNDQTINQNDGTLINGPTFDSGNRGSIVFDGSNDYIDISNFTPVLSNSIQATVSLWFNRDADSNYVLLDIKDGSNGRIALQSYFSNTLYIYLNSKSYNVSSLPISANNWYNMVLVYNGSGSTNADKLKLYLNAIERTGGTYSGAIDSSIGLLSNSGHTEVGRTPSIAYFNGKISNIKIYNRALSATEVAQNYNALKGRFGL